MMSSNQENPIMQLKEQIVSKFTLENWNEIGLLTNTTTIIQQYPRLLKSLKWNDDDYAGHVLTVLTKIDSLNEESISDIKKYIDEKYGDKGYYISDKPSERKITFAPNIFDIPTSEMEKDLIAVMMPFNDSLNKVYETIIKSAESQSFRAVRVDNIWENSVIIQDIFELIYKSKIVIADLTGKNANVMYEVGIAHTLGKLVIPISQNIQNNIPFDLQHHRALEYLPNDEGLEKLNKELISKLKTLNINSKDLF